MPYIPPHIPPHTYQTNIYRMKRSNPKIKPLDLSLDLKAAPENYVEKIPEVNANPEDFRQPIGDAENDAFLKAVRKVESDNGQNINHKVMESGPHKGDAAIGDYGLMPNTVRDVAKKLENKQSLLHEKLGPDYSDPEVQALAQLPNDQIKQALLDHPEMQNVLARYLAKHLDAMHNGDLSKMAYGWNAGSALPSSKISNRKLTNSNYLSKFKSAYPEENPPEGLGPVYNNQDVLLKDAELQNPKPRFQKLQQMLKKPNT